MAILNRAQRAFLAWHGQAHPEVRSEIQLGRRTRRGWEFGFASSDDLQGHLGWDLMVSVCLGDQWWDDVYGLDLPRVRRQGAGFACVDCVDPQGEAVPTKRAPWTWAELIGPSPNRRVNSDDKLVNLLPICGEPPRV